MHDDNDDGDEADDDLTMRFEEDAALVRIPYAFPTTAACGVSNEDEKVGGSAERGTLDDPSMMAKVTGRNRDQYDDYCGNYLTYLTG